MFPCTFITSVRAFSQSLRFFFVKIIFHHNPSLYAEIVSLFFLQPYGHTRGEILLSLNYNPGCNTLTVGITKAKNLIHFDAHSNRGELLCSINSFASNMGNLRKGPGEEIELNMLKSD